MKKIPAFLLVFIFFAFSTALLAAACVDLSGRPVSYTLSEIQNGAAGDSPVLNSLIDRKACLDEPNFILHQQPWEESPSPAALSLQPDDKEVVLSVRIHNDNIDPDAAARGVKIRFYTTSMKYAGKQFVKAVITMDDGGEKTYTDTLAVSANRDFYLVPEYDNPNLTRNGTLVSEVASIVFREGTYVGVNGPDGIIPPGESAEVNVRFSVRYRPVKTVPVPEGSGREASQAKAWNLLQLYSDPSYFRKQEIRFVDADREKRSYYSRAVERGGEEYRYLAGIAKQVTAYSHSDYDMIYAVASAIANRMFYDDQYLTAYSAGDFPLTNFDPKDVWDSKIGACAGFSTLAQVMLDSLDIPCQVIDGKDHVYNAAYCRSLDRWVLFCCSGMCGNHLRENGDLEKGGFIDISYFDMDAGYMAGNTTMYMIMGVNGAVKGNTVYHIYTDGNAKTSDQKEAAFLDPGTWFASPIGKLNKFGLYRPAASLAGYPVKEQ